jgi:hypothetical protein
MTECEKEIREKIIKELEISHKKLIERKKERNFDLIVSDENGNVIAIPARNL